jgi:Domain of unknown function (DUF4145)
MIFTSQQDHHQSDRTEVRLICPNCRNRAILEKTAVDDLYFGQMNEPTNSNSKFAGIRKCPNQDCHALIFFVKDARSKNILVSYPTSTIDFDSSDIPNEIVKNFTEALVCHGNQAYTASAIMVRKTLEEVCKQNGATGKNLKEKITDLRNKITISQELLDGIDELRILGNNAAHIEAIEYDEIGKEEVEIAIDVTKEVLKAVYQHKSLVERLKNLKKSKTP